MNTNGKDPLTTALNAMVYTPVGLALMACQRIPRLVNDLVCRGLAQLGEAEARVNQARMIGQVAVVYGGRQVRREVDTRLAEARRRAGDLAGFLPGLGGNGDRFGDLLAEAPPPPGARPAPTAPTTPTAPGPAGEAAPAPPPRPAAAKRAAKAPSGRRRTAASRRPPAGPAAADLPIPEYDGLSASQVVSRLSGLSPAELEAVRAYEAAGRGRKTVLGAIDRLRPPGSGASPSSGVSPSP